MSHTTALRPASRPVLGALGLLAGLLSAAGTARAFPTSAPLEGPTGLGLIPTTDTLPDHVAELSAGYEAIDLDSGGSVRFAPTLTAGSGVKKAEIGIGYHDETFHVFGDQLQNKFIALHAKYRFKGGNNDGQHGLALAVGIHQLQFFDEGGHVTSLYAVGSYPVLRRASGPATLRAHLGVVHNVIQLPGVDNATRPMLGLEWAPTRNITIAADHIAKNKDAFKQSSLIARYQTKSSWGAQIGVGQLGPDNDRKVFGAITWRLKENH